MKNRSEFDEARQLMSEEYFVDAIKILKKLQKSEPYNSAIKFELAFAWINSGISLDRGEKYLIKLIENNSRVCAIASIELARVYLRKKKYIEARELLENILKVPNKEKKYVYSELLFLNLREENYEEAYKYFLEELSHEWSRQASLQLYAYLRYKLGKIKDIDKMMEYYFYSQMIDYNEEKAIEHIKLHLDENDEKQNHSIYTEDVNIEKLYEKAKIKITNINPSRVAILDKYIVECDNIIGKTNGEEVDCLQVITLPNTNNIITMYPTYNLKTRVKK